MKTQFTIVPDEIKEFTDPFLADEFIQQFVCSACWGEILKLMERDPDTQKRRYVMKCGRCGDDTRGYILRKTAQRKEEQSRMDLIVAKRTLRDQGLPWLKVEKLSERQIMAELGF